MPQEILYRKVEMECVYNPPNRPDAGSRGALFTVMGFIKLADHGWTGALITEQRGVTKQEALEVITRFFYVGDATVRKLIFVEG